MTDDVSRETEGLSPPDPVTREVFPASRWPLVERYAELLATAGVQRGLIGPREAPRLWDRHLANCAVLEDLMPRGASVCDVGSGAGLPGVVLALVRPDLQVALLEPLLRRTTFLEEVVADLGLANVEVLRGRAEELHGARTFDVVTSRAVAPLDRLLGWSMPLVAGAGAMVAMKGSSVADEIAAARPMLTKLRCASPTVHRLGSGAVDPPTTAVRVAWADPARVGWRPPSGDVPRRRRSR